MEFIWLFIIKVINSLGGNVYKEIYVDFYYLLFLFVVIVEVDEEVYRGDCWLVQVFILFYVGINFECSVEIMNNVFFNVFWGINGGVDGFEVGGFYNKIINDVEGVQIVGVGSQVGGDVIGIQVGGVFNVNNGKV